MDGGSGGSVVEVSRCHGVLVEGSVAYNLLKPGPLAYNEQGAWALHQGPVPDSGDPRVVSLPG